jgi:MFS family permease
MAKLARVKTTRHYNQSVVWTIVGMSWGFFSYAYAGSIIGTTLGNQSLLSRALSINVSSGQPSFSIYMDLTTRNDVPALIGTATGLFYAGGAFGAMLNSYLADKIGRKWTVCVAAIISIIATACTAGSVNIGMFIAFRFFVGLG